MRTIAFLFSICLVVLLAIACASTSTNPKSTNQPPPQADTQGRQPSQMDAGSGGIAGEGEMSQQSGVKGPEPNDANGDGVPDSSDKADKVVDLPPGWPNDATVMDGFTITVSVDKGDGGLVVGAVGDIKLEDTLAYYRRLPGWTIISDSVTTPGTSKQGHILVLTRPSGSLNVTVEEYDKKVHLNLTYTRAK
jgi:hypothetical protein